MNFPDNENLKAKLEAHINTLANFSCGEIGVTRLSYSSEDRKARDYIIAQVAEIGLEVNTDGFGNMRVRLSGKDDSLPPVAAGSHIDSVPEGGRFDGVLGVIGALEALRWFKQHGPLKRAVEMIIFAEEEGSNCGPSCIGSKGAAGVLKPDDLKTINNKNGKSLYAIMKDFGLDPDRMPAHVIKPNDYHAWIELHVEQARRLSMQNKKLAVVTSNFGVRLLEVRLTGEANHAGSTPMDVRRDTLCAASEMILDLEDLARSKLAKDLVATVGYIEVQPNSFNVIPGNLKFIVDLRHVEADAMEDALTIIRKNFKEIATRRQIEVQFELLSKGIGVKMSPMTMEVIRESAVEMGVVPIDLYSGAVHDTALLCNLTNAGMIFIPSKDGVSHSPDEYSTMEDITLGVQVLIRALEKLANQ